MDPRYLSIIPDILSHEGGLSEDSDDPGGVTQWGVSLRWLRSQGVDVGDLDEDGDVDADDIRAMTRRDAVRLYHDHWWRAYGYGELHLVVAAKVLDLSINMGPKQAHILLQRAVRGAGGATLKEDGIIGPMTKDSLRRVPHERVRACLRSEAAGFYRALVTGRPALAKYLTGWLNRAYGY